MYNVKLFYIFYEEHTITKTWYRKGSRNLEIYSSGLFEGTHFDFMYLLDYYDYADRVVYECVYPIQEVQNYFEDIRDHKPYQYNKLMKFLINMQTKNIAGCDEEFFLLMLGLGKKL